MIGFLSRLFDLLSPRLCAGCGDRLSVGEQHVCAVCLMRLPRTNYFESPYENKMADCFYSHQEVARVAAWLYYYPENLTSEVVKQLKYYDRPELGDYLGSLMAGEAMRRHFFDGIEAIIAVPLAPKRERQRGYNQSLLLAQGISRQTGIPVVTDAVVRTTFVDSQTHMSHEERRENVSGVFQLVDADAIRGRHVLIVDDVVTTGATIMSLLDEVLKASVSKVSILSLAFTHEV